MSRRKKEKREVVMDWSHPGLYAPIYIPLLSMPQYTTKILLGSRNSVKSTFACMAMVQKCLKSEHGQFKCLMMRKVKEDVKKSVYATIKKVCERTLTDHLFRFSDNRYEIKCLTNGNMFLPQGSYETQGRSGNAKSIENPTDLIYDEASELSENEYDDLTLSLRGSPNPEEYLILNPVDTEHWIVKRFFPEPETFERADGSHTYIQSKIRNCIILHTTYMNNPFLQDAERTKMEIMKETRPEKYKSDGLGLLRPVKTGGEATKNFEYDKHVTKEKLFNPVRRVLECWDYNRRPHHTVGIWQFHADDAAKIFYCDLTKEFAIPEASVRDVQKKINAYLREQRYEPKTIRYAGDYNGTAQRDVDVQTFTAKVIRQIEADGFRCIDETKTNPPVVSSLEFLDDIFGGFVTVSDVSNYPDYEIRIRINAECRYHIADFQKTKTDKDGQLLKLMKSEKITDGDAIKTVSYQIRGHAVDATRYMVVGVFEYEYEKFRQND